MKAQIKAVLTELEKTQKTYWNITPEVGLFLNQLIRKTGAKKVLEIGSSNGYSGIWLAEALTHNKGQLHTMESNAKKRYPLAVINFAKSKLPNINAILGHAPEDIPKGKFDIAFFDATKEEHGSYFDALSPHCKMIITDNIDSHREALTPFINKVKKAGWTSYHLPIGTGLLISLPKSSS
ncbi:class I SAM-dependent methyltransferase [Candidatus Gracilibacteria bacterium]|nr:class I SAM-dependent methyltransferase [Candidatus Gracilibacteria bacterium]